MIRHPPTSPLFPTTPLSRSAPADAPIADRAAVHGALGRLELGDDLHCPHLGCSRDRPAGERRAHEVRRVVLRSELTHDRDRKSTRLNSSHSQISYAVFCLKK